MKFGLAAPVQPIAEVRYLCLVHSIAQNEYSTIIVVVHVMGFTKGEHFL